MIYVTSDIHNNYDRFTKLLEVLKLTDLDTLYILGDIFDRCDYAPKPLELYFELLRQGDRCKVIAGNHDILLADYIKKYYKTSEKKRSQLDPYLYNSFDIMKKRLTEVDMLVLADRIYNWPYQLEVTVNNQIYLLAHSKTVYPTIQEESRVFTSSTEDSFLHDGICGYISVCGHYNPGGSSIWKNERRNVFIVDCGAGYRSGRLGCICLDNYQEIYVD